MTSPKEPSTEPIEKLIALVRDLYPEKEADEIVASFEAVFAAATDMHSREALISHWLDFYRLQQFKRYKQRRRPTFQERSRTCAACGYPSSHRHHLYDFATHGENEATLQLCANCHELHHLLYNALVRESEYSRKIAQHVMFSGKLPADVVVKILGWCLATIRYEASNGWVDGARGSREWVEKRLRWSEFERQTGGVLPADEDATQPISPAESPRSTRRRN
jgi:ribosomal protein L37E